MLARPWFETWLPVAFRGEPCLERGGDLTGTPALLAFKTTPTRSQDFCGFFLPVQLVQPRMFGFKSDFLEYLFYQGASVQPY